jgi:hypothetical protein
MDLLREVLALDARGVRADPARVADLVHGMRAAEVRLRAAHAVLLESAGHDDALQGLIQTLAMYRVS